MKVYRDCINGSPFAPFEGFPDPNGNINPAVFTVFDALGNVILSSIFTPISKSPVPPSNNSPCAPTTSGNVCVEEAIYEATVNLPPLPGGYYIAYQRCCRNGTILNLINPGAVGATYWEHIPGPEVVAVNNSPRFSNRPPTYICSNIPIAFDHVATDPDGDSLVYSLCSPFDGLSSACPLVSPANANGCPTVNEAPPYPAVPFDAPYSGAFPLASNPAININPQTGFLNGNPTILGQWVMGVCVSEYRNGVLIGVHHRDFQFNVINCPFIVSAGIVSQTTTNNGQGTGFCNGLTITYANDSYPPLGQNGTTYLWDFGDPNTTTDTSSLWNPSYTFNQIGTYTVTLIVNPGSPCADTTKEVFQVYPLLSPNFLSPSAQCFNNNSFNFSAQGTVNGSGLFFWDFGPNATPQTANNANVNNVVFNTVGTHTVTLTLNENDCTASVTKTVSVFQNPIAAVATNTYAGCDPLTVNFVNNSTPPNSLDFIWTFSDGTTSTATNPTKVFSPPGIYSYSIQAISNQNCVDTSSIFAANSITVSPSPNAGFTATPTITTIFEPDIFFFNTTDDNNIISWEYNFGDGGQSNMVNPSHSYNAWGDYTVTQTVINTYGCPNTTELLIRILPEFRFWIPNAFTPGQNDGLNDVFKPIIMGVEDYNFMIFNRWGQLIFKTNDINEGWNGTYLGKKSPMDVYVWKCEFRNLVSRLPESHVGHVTLVR